MPGSSQCSPRRVGDRVDVGAVAAEGLEEAEPSLDDGRRPGQAVAGQVGGDDAGVGGPAAVDPLDGAAGAVGLEQARAHGRRDPRRVGDPRRRPARRPSPRPRPHRPPRRWRSREAALEELRRPAVLVVAAHAQADRHLDADPGGVEHLGTGRAGGLGDGQRRRHDGRGRVQHRRQVGVVEVEGVGEGAVDERGRGAGDPQTGGDGGRVRRAAPAPDHRGHRRRRRDGSPDAARLLPTRSSTRRATSCAERVRQAVAPDGGGELAPAAGRRSSTRLRWPAVTPTPPRTGVPVSRCRRRCAAAP